MISFFLWILCFLRVSKFFKGFLMVFKVYMMFKVFFLKIFFKGRFLGMVLGGRFLVFFIKKEEGG